MRPTVSATARDLGRLCARCRLGASLSSSPQSPLAAWPGALATAPTLAAASSPYTSLLQQRSYSQEAPSAASSASSAPSAASSSSSSASSSSAPAPTHYDLFPATLPSGPPPAGHFPIDTRALRREFLSLQARAHPDMHPAGPAKARAEAASARINDAYKTLANPLLRAQYLLALRGVDVATDESLKVDEPGLLLRVLEAREAIDDACLEQDLDEPRRLNDERIAASEDALEHAFRHDDVDAAKREAVRLRYWVNIKESLDNWERGKPVVLQH